MGEQAQETKRELLLDKAEKALSVFLRAVKRLIFLIPPMIVLVSMLVTYHKNGLYPFGDKTISWCDMDQQVVPLLLDFKNILEGKEGFFFSFNNAGGMNFFGVFFFFLSSPFSFLVAFVDSAEVMSFANVLVLLKMCAISSTASVYFSIKHKKAYLLNVVSSVLYAYSGYVMMYFQNVIWLDIVYMFPLLLLGLERLKEGRRGLFIGTLAACVAMNYYIAYMLVVFLLLYAFVYVWLEKDKRFAGNFCLCCGIAALLSAVVWLPSLLQYFSSGRKSSIIASLRYSSVFSAYQTTFPTVFSVLFLFPFALSDIRKTDKDNRLRYILFLATLAPIVFEPINKMWQTGNYMSFPTRYAFITIFLCLSLAMDCMAVREKDGEVKEGFTHLISASWWRENGKNEAPRYAVSVLTLVLSIFYYIFARDYTSVNYERMDQYSQSLWGNGESFEALLSLYVIACLLGVGLYVLYRVRLLKQVGLWLCIAIMAVSELYVAPMTYMLSPAHDVAYYQDIVDLADKIEDEGFYRVKTDRSYSWRDFDVNMMGGIGYNGLGHYTSLTASNYMTAIKQFGYTSYWMEVGNSGGTLLTDALLSVKYCISGQVKEGVYQGEYYNIAPTEYYLPLGIVTAQDVIKNEGEDYTKRGELQRTLYEDFFGTDDGVSVYTLEDATLYNLTVEEVNGKHRLTPLSGTGEIRFEVPVSALETLYFNVFDENNNALNQAINEKFSIYTSKVSVSSYPTQRNNGFLCLGEYKTAAIATVRVTVDEEVTVRDLSVFGIKGAALKNAVESAKTVGLTEKKNGLIGEYTAHGGECVFLSVAYTEGMRLKINGKRAQLYEVYDGFTAFYLEEGVNEIELSFRPNGFVIGIFAVCIGVGILLSLMIWKKKKEVQFVLPEKINTLAYFGVLAAGIAVLCAVYVFPLLLSAL
ncbi:MAG: hypothetical protein E7377_00895 [Clostridiales bacterium]|nr:hypothetical protein [Clostridiales bacterium]